MDGCHKKEVSLARKQGLLFEQNLETRVAEKGIEEDLMDNVSIQSKILDMEDKRKGWQTSRPMKMRRKNIKQVVVATKTKPYTLAEPRRPTATLSSFDLGLRLLNIWFMIKEIIIGNGEHRAMRNNRWR